MEKLLRLTDQVHWNLDGIEFAIEERVGNPQDFIGRVEEMAYLYQWASSVQRGISRSLAFLGRRKTGKSLMLERLYNIAPACAFCRQRTFSANMAWSGR